MSDILTAAGKTITTTTEAPPELKGVTLTMPDNLLSDSATSSITIDHKPVTESKPEVQKESAPSKQSEDKALSAEPVKQEVKVEPKKEEGVLKAPKEEPKKKEESAPALKAESQPVEKKEISKLITPVKDTNKEEDKFDFSKYSPQEVVNMKNMSRQSREAYAAVLDDNKKLSGLKDANYLQHEQAYVLAPEYQQLQGRERSARIEGQAWEQALLDIKAGKPFKNITGFDQQGNPTYVEMQPSIQEEIRVGNNLQLCIQAIHQFKAQQQTFPQQYQSRVRTDLGTLENIRKERFAWVANPAIMDYSVDVDGKEMKVKDIISDFKSAVPAYMANTPGFTLAADMWVALQIRTAELREATKGRQVEQIKKEEVIRGEPSSDNADTGIRPTAKNGLKIPEMMSLENAPFERH